MQATPDQEIRKHIRNELNHQDKRRSAVWSWCAGLAGCFLVVFMLTSVDLGSNLPFEGGSGLADDPWQIATAQQLNSVRFYPEGHFILTADIDLNVAPFNFDFGWVPIGDGQVVFMGTFDGNDKTIHNLYINRSGAYQGLFGYTEEAVISNFTLDNVDVTGTIYVGGLIGYSGISTIVRNSSVEGSVSGDFSVFYPTFDGFSVGGLVGINAEGSLVNNSHAAVSVKGNTYIGGLVGHNTDSSTITNSFATSTVRGVSEVGGLVGRNSTAATILRSYATGRVSGNSYVGGLVGDLEAATIENSYATGFVTGINSVGGLVGASTFPKITNSYSASPVRGENNIGGLLGVSLDDSTITSSFWDVDVSGVDVSAGGIGKPTEEMIIRSTYADAGWDFETVWGIEENVTYPELIAMNDNDNDNDSENDHDRRNGGGCFVNVFQQ